LLLFLSIHKATAQENTFNKNLIHTSIGSGGLYFSATVYYDRIIKQKMWNRNITSFIRVGYGSAVYYGSESSYLLTQYGILTGVKKHHLEVSVGPAYFTNRNLLGDYSPTAALGWRYQKPGGNFIFRLGIAVPEAIYLGLGIAF